MERRLLIRKPDQVSMLFARLRRRGDEPLDPNETSSTISLVELENYNVEAGFRP